MLVILPTLLAFTNLLSVTVRADHSTCGWTGPGPGDPTQYNFTLWCWANKIIIVPVDPGPPSHDHAIYLCGDNRDKVADWNVLGGTGSQLLEIATPCNRGGYALTGHTCPNEYWAVCLSNSSDPRAIGQCYFLTSFNDCQWPGTFDIATLPVYIGIFRK